MKYYQCPSLFRKKAHGCGFGPVNATVAFLDLGNICPNCGIALKVYRKPTGVLQTRDAQQGVENARALFGDAAAASYAKAKGLDKE